MLRQKRTTVINVRAEEEVKIRLEDISRICGKSQADVIDIMIKNIHYMLTVDDEIFKSMNHTVVAWAKLEKMINELKG